MNRKVTVTYDLPEEVCWFSNSGRHAKGDLGRKS